MVIVYGTDTCPHTSKARAELTAQGKQPDFRNVQQKKEWLDEMLTFSGGGREIPVVVEDGKVLSIGWNGRA